VTIDNVWVPFETVYIRVMTASYEMRRRSRTWQLWKRRRTSTHVKPMITDDDDDNDDNDPATLYDFSLDAVAHNLVWEFRMSRALGCTD